jgi:hypothetical protein
MSNNVDPLKEAFGRVKQDIFSLGSELSELRNELSNIKNSMIYLDETVNKLRLDLLKNQENTEKAQENSSTDNLNSSTDPVISTDTSTDNYVVEPFKCPNINSSIGNGGVSTDRQTIRQTDTSTHFTHNVDPNQPNINSNVDVQPPIDQTIQKAAETIESLDQIKKEIRIQFKQMTDQEMLVFSTIYQLQEQQIPEITYKVVAKTLNLSQSSIRDYVQRMLNKGIPIRKTKHNNKKITLEISPELRKIASLETIMRLREI